MDRAIQALARMREVCQRRGVRRISAVATAAVREAENGPWFVRRVRQELDIPLRIIDAETEAALSYRSVAHHFRAGRRADPRRRHRRGQPRADRRGGRAGGAHALPAARRGAPDRALPVRASAPRTRRSRQLRSSVRKPAQARLLRPRVGGAPRSSARAARSPAWAAWCRPAAASRPAIRCTA